MTEYSYSSPLGTLRLTTDGTALTALRLTDEASHPAGAPDVPALRSAVRWLDAYFAGHRPGLLPEMQPQGTPFQRRVWQELLRIPYGHTVSYGELARRLGCRSAQAVGQAVGRNPIAILIPCHRVVAAHGLGGYAYGAAIKQKLLKIEQQ